MSTRRAPLASLRRQSAGFTLAELLVSIILLTIVSLTLANFIANWTESSSLAKARSDLLAKAESSLDTVATDITLSGSTDTNNRWQDTNAPGAPTDLFSWQSNASTLILAKAALGQDHNIIFSDSNKYISEKDNVIYFTQNGNLYRRVLASTNPNDAAKTTCPSASASPSCPADKLVASNVTNFSVKYYDANNALVAPTDARSVALQITLSSKKGGQNVTATYSTRMVFRNV